MCVVSSTDMLGNSVLIFFFDPTLEVMARRGEAKFNQTASSASPSPPHKPAFHFVGLLIGSNEFLVMGACPRFRFDLRSRR